MGFFSSIGKVFKKVAAPVAGVLGTALSGGNPAVGAAMAGVTDSIWNGGSSGSSNSDWYKSAYGDQMAFAREQFDFNKQYIQNQLQWRVDDAKKAGLHPMAVLGLNGASFSPVSSPSIPSLPESTYDPSELGQSVAYASTKAKTNKQQEQAFAMAQATAGVQMEGLELDNEYKRLQIMEMVSRLTQTGPAAPDLNGGNNLIGGQNDSPFPHGNTYTDNTRPLLELGRIGDTLVEYVNPDLADSVNEDMLKKLAVRIATEGQNARTALQAFRHFTKREQAAVLRGDADIIRDMLTGSWMFKWKSHMKPRKNPDGSISGKIIW